MSSPPLPPVAANFMNAFRAPSFGGVILAAGASSRMGTDKALLPWPPQAAGSAPSNETFLSSAIKFLMYAADFVVVVAGANASQLSPIAYENAAFVAVNPDPARGQFSSLQLGLREVLNRGRDAAIVTLVDRPPASRATLEALRSAFIASPDDIWAVVPEFSGRHGHPYLIGREFMEAFMRAQPTENARDIEHRYQQHIQYVPVDDPFVALNINTPEDYAGLTARK